MSEPSEQYEIENERMNEIAILQNELQSLREKLRESEATNAELKRINGAFDYDSATDTYQIRELTEENEALKKALADHHQTNQELLQKYSDAMIPKGEVSELKAKLAVAVDVIEAVKLLLSGTTHSEIKLQRERNLDSKLYLYEQALAEINKQGEV